MGECENYLNQKHNDNIKIACRTYPIINKNQLKKYETRLYQESYLPRYLLHELDILHYYKTLKENNLYGEYKEQLLKHPHNMREDLQAKEFYEWVQKNNEYKGLLHTDNYTKLTNTLDMLKDFQETVMKDFRDKGYLGKEGE
jgi:hypothetical protein